MSRLLLVSILTLVSLGQADTTPTAKCHRMLDDALTDKNPDTRKEAVIALSLDVVSDRLISQLASMLDDKDVPVREAAVVSLSDLKSPRTAGILEKALGDPVPEVAFAAAKALYELHVPAGQAALLAVLSGQEKTSSGFVRSQFRQGMRMLHTPKAAFLMGLKQGLGFVPLPGFGEGLSSFQGILSDNGVSGRATAALLLGHQRDAATVRALRRALGDDDWSVRAAAIHSLALQNDTTVQPQLAFLLDDAKLPVRLRAAAAWLRLDAILTARRHRTLQTR